MFSASAIKEPAVDALAVVRSLRCPLSVRFNDYSSRDAIWPTFSGGILMKLATNIRHMSEHYWKCFQGQRS